MVTKRKRTNNHDASLMLFCMTFFGFVILGVFDHSTNLTSAPLSNFPFEFVNTQALESEKGRRYCDPPNMTIVYEVSSEEVDFHIAEVRDGVFQVNLTSEEKVMLFGTQSTSWGMLFSCIPASQLVIAIGPKRVFGYSLVLMAVWNSLAHIDSDFFENRGYLNGVFIGAIIPSFYQLSVNWFVPNRRSSFASLLSGQYLGYAFYEVLLIIILKYNLYVHLIMAIFTFIWYVPWSTVINDAPHEASINTKTKVKRPNGSSNHGCTLNLPLWKILGSRPVWMSVSAIFAASCGEVAINKGIPLYLKYVYKVSAKKKIRLFHNTFANEFCPPLIFPAGGYLPAISYILLFLSAMGCGYFVDFLLKIKFVSVTSLRRMVVYISHFFPAALLFVVGFVGCNVLAPIIFFFFASAALGANYSGAFSSPLDLSPRYTAVITAICFTFSRAGSLFMTYLIPYVLTGQLLGSWRFIFSLTSLILLVSSIFFMLRGSGSIQPWNNFEEDSMKNSKTVRNQQARVSIVPPLPKSRTKSIYTVEKKILKVLHVQEPEKFTRVRAYSTSLPNERSSNNAVNVYRPSNKKRASIS